jgi:hypothetical protein
MAKSVWTLKDLLNYERIIMSTITIIHEMRIAYEAGLRFWRGKDPEARKDFERVVELGEENVDARPAYYELAHKQLADIYAFVGDDQKAAYYRKRFGEIAAQA